MSIEIEGGVRSSENSFNDVVTSNNSGSSSSNAERGFDPNAHIDTLNELPPLESSRVSPGEARGSKAKNALKKIGLAVSFAAACVPVIGGVVGLIMERIIVGKIRKEINEDTATKNIVQLVNIKNGYKACGIVCCLLSIAALVTLVATGILPVVIGCTVAAIFVFTIGVHSFSMHKNRTLLKGAVSGGDSYFDGKYIR